MDTVQRLRAEIEKLRTALREERQECRRLRAQLLDAWACIDALKRSSALVAQVDENKQAAALLAAVIRQEWLKPDPETGRPWRSIKDFVGAPGSRDYTERTVRRALRELPKDSRPKRGRPGK